MYGNHQYEVCGMILIVLLLAAGAITGLTKQNLRVKALEHRVSVMEQWSAYKAWDGGDFTHIDLTNFVYQTNGILISP